MGTARSQDPLHGIVVPDEQFSADNIKAKGSGATDSDYTETGPIAALPVPAESDYLLSLKAHGVPVADSRLQLVTQRAGHPVPDGAAVTYLDLEADDDDVHHGWDHYGAITGFDEIAYTTSAVNEAPPAVLRLDCDPAYRGRVLVAGVETTANTPRVYRYDPETETWASSVSGVVGAAGVRYALVELPSGRVLLIHVTSDYRQISVRSSDDGGATWADYAEHCCDVGLYDSTGANYTPHSISAAYSNGQILLMIWYDQPSMSIGALAQYSSVDLGATFEFIGQEFIDAWILSESPVVLPLQPAGFAVVCYARNFVTGDAMPTIARLGSSAQSLDSAETLQLRADDFDPDGFVWLTAWVDESGVIYVLCTEVDDPDTPTMYGLQMYRSTDGGLSAEPYTSWTWTSGSKLTYLEKFNAVSTRGRALICTRWTVATGGDSYDGSSVGVVYLGGDGRQTLPCSIVDLTEPDHEVNRQTWAPSSPYHAASTPTIDEAASWLPITKPDATGWTKSGTGTFALTADGEGSLTTTAAQTLLYRIDTSGAADRLMAEWGVRITAGDGDDATDEILVRLRLADASAYEYDVKIRMDAAGFTVYDVAGTSVVATVARDLTTETLFRVAMDKDDLCVWTCAAGEHVSEWQTDVDSATITDAGGTANTSMIQWGHGATAASVSYWRPVQVSYLPYYWTPRELGQFAGSWSSPDSLFPRPLSTRPIGLPHGLYVSADGGPTSLSESWILSVDHEHPIWAIDPRKSPSPRHTWRSLNDDDAVEIVWDLEDLFSDAMQDNTALACFILGANFKSAAFGWYDSGWSEVDIDAEDGYGPLKYVRRGRKVRPDTSQATQGERYIHHEDHVGDHFELGSGGGEGASTVVRIDHNTEGAWVGSGSTTKRPTMVLDSDGMAGTEQASGTAGYVWRRNFGIVISGMDTVDADTFRLRIPAHTTAEGYFEIGAVVIGPVSLLSTDYDWGYTWTHLVPVDVRELTDGTTHTRVDGPPRRRFAFALAEGVVDLTGVNDDDPDVDYRAIDDGLAEPAGAIGDTTRVLEGVLRRAEGADVPVLMLTSIARQDVSPGNGSVQQINQSRAMLWGRIRTDVITTAIQGDELADEVERSELIEVEEVV